jgi:hypothetical protein
MAVGGSHPSQVRLGKALERLASVSNLVTCVKVIAWVASTFIRNYH